MVPLPFSTPKQPGSRMVQLPSLSTEKPLTLTATWTLSNIISLNSNTVVCTLMDHAKNIPSTKQEILLETKCITQALSANNYPTNFLCKGHQPITKREISTNDTDQRGLVILAYAKGFSEKNCESSKKLQHTSKSHTNPFAPSPTF